MELVCPKRRSPIPARQHAALRRAQAALEPGPHPVGVPAVAFAGVLGALAWCLGFVAVRARLAR